jgi:hypothetical protein
MSQLSSLGFWSICIQNNEAKFNLGSWCSRQDSNRLPHAYKSDELYLSHPSWEKKKNKRISHWSMNI